MIRSKAAGALRSLRRNVIAWVALFVAIGGTSYAAATIGPGDIQTDAVRTRHIANGHVRAQDLARDSVVSSRIRTGQVFSADLRNRTIRGGDVRDDALGGEQIREQNLDTVPDADRLGGSNPSAFLTGAAQAENESEVVDSGEVTELATLNLDTFDEYVVFAQTQVRNLSAGTTFGNDLGCTLQLGNPNVGGSVQEPDAQTVFPTRLERAESAYLTFQVAGTTGGGFGGPQSHQASLECESFGDFDGDAFGTTITAIKISQGELTSTEEE